MQRALATLIGDFRADAGLEGDGEQVLDDLFSDAALHQVEEQLSSELVALAVDDGDFRQPQPFLRLQKGLE